MTAWYVRPDTSHSATRNGASYATAWGGWAAIVWGGAGVVAGDTLYVCGAHSAGAILAVGPHGATVSSRVKIRGDYADDPGSITFTSGSFYLNVNRAYTTVQNLTITAANYSCIGLGGAPLTGVHIRGCTFNGGGNSAVLFLAFNGWSYIDCIIDGNAFLGGAGAVGGAAIQWYATSAGSVTSLSNLQISNNTFTGCSAARATILLKALNTVGAATKMADITVSGNTFIDCVSVMMEIYGPDLVDGGGAVIAGHNTGVKVLDNIIRNQTEISGLGGGIVLGGFAQSLTADFGENIVRNNKAYELYGISGFVNLFYGTYSVSGNYADGIGTSTIDGNGVLFDHGCDSCEAFGNEFHNIRGTGADGYYSGGFGILVLDATNCKAYGNVIDGCVTGVAFGNKNAGQSANIFNNTFRNCSQAGAYLVGGADPTSNLVRNNVFTATRSTPSVKNDAATWTGESHNCFHGFGVASGHTLAASTVTIDPDLDADYRPRTPYIKVGGTYLGGNDFYGNQFSSPAPMGAVNDEAIVSLSSPQQTELQKAVTRAVYFVQLEFASSTQYLCTANITLTWGGHDWLGFGTVGGISPIEESEGVESRALTFTLSVAQQSVLALAVGAVEEYRGKIAKMYFCPLDESFQLVGTPQLCWRGIMDLMAIGVEGEEGKITLKCETSAYGLKRQPNLRLNAAQHKKRYPNDTGFDYLNDLIATPSVWLSKKFQRSIN